MIQEVGALVQRPPIAGRGGELPLPSNRTQPGSGGVTEQTSGQRRTLYGLVFPHWKL